jgi:hypothetical protein
MVWRALYIGSVGQSHVEQRVQHIAAMRTVHVTRGTESSTLQRVQACFFPCRTVPQNDERDHRESKSSFGLLVASSDCDQRRSLSGWLA